MPTDPTAPGLSSTAAQSDTFGETLLESLRQTPWLLVSLGLHGLLLLLLAQLDFGTRAVAADTKIEANLVQETLEVLEPEIEPEIEPDTVEPEIVEPTLTDTEVEPDPAEVPTDDARSESDSDRNDTFDSNAILGLGPGGGGGSFNRGGFGDKPSTRPNLAIASALDWLARHQDPAGSWDCDDFGAHCEDGPITRGPGHPSYDVGVTGLALLAFLGIGETHRTDRHGGTVRRGLQWLLAAQDPEGCIGPRDQENFTYGHAIATLALVEAYGMTHDPKLLHKAQRAIDFVEAARNPRSAWRYGVRSGENDISVTGWMVMALKSARMAGLRVDQRALLDVRDYLDAMTDDYGRAGYNERGSYSVRPIGKTREFPADQTEALTAAAVLSRIFLGEDPATTPVIRQGVRLLADRLPRWDPPALDFYYWYYGTLAMHQAGGSDWERWNRAMQKTLLEHQVKKGCERGSFDPVGAWGEEGGRVYSTALLTLCLEVSYRYPRVFGTR